MGCNMITYLKGDATEPVGKNRKYIIHVVNDAGAWGAGFVLALSKKWKEPERWYREFPLKLGEIQVVGVENDITVINMCAQTLNYPYPSGEIPLKYDALQKCLYEVNSFISLLSMPVEIHAPRFGSGLARGDWDIIEIMIKKELRDINVYIYDLN